MIEAYTISSPSREHFNRMHRTLTRRDMLDCQYAKFVTRNGEGCFPLWDTGDNILTIPLRTTLILPTHLRTPYSSTA